MKFVLYSDIHAQVAPLEAVLKEVEKEKADKEIMAGDFVMLGPDPGAIVDMIRGRVTGQVWATRRVETMPSGALLEVETDGGGTLIAYDPLGCAKGELVLITQGSVAAGYFTSMKAPVDALIIGSIDEK